MSGGGGVFEVGVVLPRSIICNGAVLLLLMLVWCDCRSPATPCS